MYADVIHENCALSAWLYNERHLSVARWRRKFALNSLPTVNDRTCRLEEHRLLLDSYAYRRPFCTSSTGRSLE
jgi:hypothetical protein